MKTPVTWLSVPLLAIATTIGNTPATAETMEIAPHRAVYELSMGKARATSRYSGVEGLVTRSVEKTCDGWIVAEHLVMRISTRVGGLIDREIRFTSWESDDATDYRFASRTLSKAGGEDERTKGRLKVAKEGSAGKAIYSLPEGVTVNVPDDTYLPISHIRKLLATAKAGDKQVRFHIFDGSEADGPEIMSSFIVGPLPITDDEKKPKASADEEKPDSMSDLASGPGWRINAAFFDSKDVTAVPTFQMDMELMANGLPRHMVLDLDDFTIVQTLREIKSKPKPAC